MEFAENVAIYLNYEKKKELIMEMKSCGCVQNVMALPMKKLWRRRWNGN